MNFPLNEVGASEQAIDISGLGNHGHYLRSEGEDGGLLLAQDGLAVGTGTAAGFRGGALRGEFEEPFDDELTIAMFVSLEQASEVLGTIALVSDDVSPVFGLVETAGSLAIWNSYDFGVVVYDPPLDIGVARHVAVTYTEEVAVIYVDGVEEARLILPESIAIEDSRQVWIGAWGKDNVLPFHGDLDDFQMFDRALSETEVAVLAANPGKGLAVSEGLSYRPSTVGDVLIERDVRDRELLPLQNFFGDFESDSSLHYTVEIDQSTFPAVSIVVNSNGVLTLSYPPHQEGLVSFVVQATDESGFMTFPSTFTVRATASAFQRWAMSQFASESLADWDAETTVWGDSGGPRW